MQEGAVIKLADAATIPAGTTQAYLVGTLNPYNGAPTLSGVRVEGRHHRRKRQQPDLHARELRHAGHDGPLSLRGKRHQDLRARKSATFSATRLRHRRDVAFQSETEAP